MCKHNKGCAVHAAAGFWYIFIRAFGIKLLLNNLSYLRSPAKLLSNLKNMKSLKDNLRFALFLALMNSVYKAVLCLTRRIFKNDKVGSVIAAIAAGLVSSVEKKSRRSFMMILLLSRASDTAFNIGENRGLVKRFNYGEILLFLITNVHQQMLHAVEPDLQNKSIYKWMRKMSITTRNESLMSQQLIKRLNDDLVKSSTLNIRL